MYQEIITTLVEKWRVNDETFAQHTKSSDQLKQWENIFPYSAGI